MLSRPVAGGFKGKGTGVSVLGEYHIPDERGKRREACESFPLVSLPSVMPPDKASKTLRMYV